MNKTQGITFGSIVGVSAIVSLVVLLNKDKDPAKPEPSSGPTPVAAPADPAKTATVAPTPVQPLPAPAPAPVPATPDTTTAEDLVKSLVAKMESKDAPGFIAVAGDGAVAPETRGALEKLIQDPQLGPDPAKPAMELAKTPDSTRWLLRLKAKDGELIQEIQADLKKDGDTWKVAKIQVPTAIASTGGTRGIAPEPDATAQLDALSVAHLFSSAAEKLDFENASRLVDPGKISDERLAALLIAMEEGKFKLLEERPLVATLVKDDISWVLTRLGSQSPAGGSEFALELGKDPQKGWLVRGLTFDKMIAALADNEGTGTAYAPIVDDVKGGESIVLFFEYDNSRVTPRTLKQLDIIAGILKLDPAKKLRINGHADAKGSDDYNEALSDKRSLAVKEALQSLGVTPAQLVTESFGETKPVRPNFNPDGSDNPQGRSRNRRAEVRLDF